jgi:hypothetical protein
MDATRLRRTRDAVRRRWYAGCRSRRFARFLGFRSSPALEKLAAPDQTDKAAILCR